MATENKPTLQERIEAAKKLAIAPTVTPTTPEEVSKALKTQFNTQYKALRLRQYSKAAGQIIKPDAKGIYTPADAEEEDILAYFAAQPIAYVAKL